MGAINTLSGSVLLIFWLVNVVSGQLSGRVGPTTTLVEKAAKRICDIRQYGAQNGTENDVGPALKAAFDSCKMGGIIVIPPGEYKLKTWVDMSGGRGFAIQWDGIIHRHGDQGGTMIVVQKSEDVEVFSTTGTGAFQGHGYQFHELNEMNGPRILRFVRVQNFSVHDIILVASPSFHFAIVHCKNGEVYNMVIRGAYRGGTDGISVWSENMWIHDVEVTNKDECVTIKSPATFVLIENVYCNWSGGSAIGSLGSNTAISNVLYRNVYTIMSNQMMMVKSFGGSGYVANVTFENFIGHSVAYALNIDQEWGKQKNHSGPGVTLTNMVFKNWKGTSVNGKRRPPIKFYCADDAPCRNMILIDVALWTDTGSSVTWLCKSAYGQGACLMDGTGGGYRAIEKTIGTPPASYSAPRLQWDLRQSTGTKDQIAIPAMPASFFPDTVPIKPLAGAASRQQNRK